MEYVQLWTNILQCHRHRSPLGRAMGVPPTHHLTGSGTHSRDFQALGSPHPGPARTNRDGGRHTRATWRLFPFPTAGGHSALGNRCRFPESRTGGTVRLRPWMVRKRESLPTSRRVDPPGEGASILPGEDDAGCLRRTLGPSPSAQLLKLSNFRQSLACSFPPKPIANGSAAVASQAPTLSPHPVDPDRPSRCAPEILDDSGWNQ